jgi:hypothetical protein
MTVMNHASESTITSSNPLSSCSDTARTVSHNELKSFQGNARALPSAAAAAENEGLGNSYQAAPLPPVAGSEVQFQYAAPLPPSVAAGNGVQFQQAAPFPPPVAAHGGVQFQQALPVPFPPPVAGHGVQFQQQQAWAGPQEPISPKPDIAAASDGAVAITPPRRRRKSAKKLQGPVTFEVEQSNSLDPAAASAAMHAEPRCDLAQAQAAFSVSASFVAGVKAEATLSNSVGSRQPFPQKLMEMLSKEGVEQSHAVCWLPHGRAFIVKQRKVFTSEIMPRYFRLTKFPSFQRQLNLYGFRMLTKGKDSGAYYHELFLKEHPERCVDIRRDTPNGNSGGGTKGSGKSPSPPPPAILAKPEPVLFDPCKYCSDRRREESVVLLAA